MTPWSAAVCSTGLLLAFALGGCELKKRPEPPTSSAVDGGACADQDRDGFGDGCARGRDCDDTKPDITRQCFSCLEPDQGCACAVGTAPAACFLDATDLPDGRLMCREGTRTCRDGAWSACESVHSYVMERRAPTQLVPDASHPNCTPCDVLCYRIDDNLDPADGGLTDANSGGVDWVPGGGLTIHSFVVDAGGPGTDGAVDNDGAVPACQLGVPPDTDCDGLDDDVDPYPGTPPFETDHDVIYHELAAGQTGTTDLDLTFNLNNADIYFLLDQSGSMNEERARLIADLRTGTFLGAGYDCADTDFDGTPNNELKSQGIVGSVRCMIRDAWFGAGYFVEYPMGNHGEAYADGDSDDEVVFRNLQPIDQSISLVDTALSRMYTNGNIDWPESPVPAMWALATGNGMYLGHNRMGVPPQTSCGAGTHGYPCFRDTAIPIVVLFTDASFHNGPAPTPNAYSASYNIAAGTQTTITPVPSTNETFATAFDVGDVTNALVTLAGTTVDATADIPGDLMGCNANSAMRDVTFKFDVSSQQAITIKTDGTVQDTLISLYGGFPETEPTSTTPVVGETYDAGDIYDQWIELTGTTLGNAANVQGGVVGCGAGGSGKDTIFSFTPSANMTVAARSGLQNRVAWFRMGDGDTYPEIVDVTGEHNGVMTNMGGGDFVSDAPTAGSFANTTSTDFDGSNDYVEVANDSALEMTDALTVSAWVKGSSQDNTIVAKYESGRRSWRMATKGTKARINVSRTGSPYDSSNIKEWDTSAVVMDGTWHHVAFTYVAGAPDGTLKVYVDGVEDTAVTRTYNPNVTELYATSAPVVIGAYYSNQDNFSGRIDEVAIWNAALSAAEIAQVYNGGSPPDLNQVGGAIIGLYSALPPSKPSATGVPNTNDSVGTAYNASANLVGSYVSFSGDTSAPGITASLDSTSVGCGADSESADALYSFQLASNRRVRIDTEGSAFDTVISLHDVAPATVEARSGTDTNETHTSPQAIGAMVGERYLYTGDTSSMTPDYDGAFVGCGAASGANDAVYSFTLASTRTVRIDTSDTSAFDSVVSLHSAIASETVTAATNTNDTLSTKQSVGTVNGARHLYSGGTTASLAADYTSAIVGCGASDSARDAVVGFTLTSPATVEIDTEGSSFDTVIGLFDEVAASDSLVSWWRMGDGDTYSTIIDVIGARNGTMTNMSSGDFEAVVPTQDHPNTRSTNFDGSNDHVLIADAAALDFTTAMTFSAWVKGASQSNAIASKYQRSGNQRSWRVFGNGSGGIAVTVSRDGTWSSTTAKEYTTSGVTPLDNTWHHVAFTYDAGTLKVFVDGAEATVTKTWDPTVSSIYSGTSEVAIGATFNGGSDDEFSGNIDEVTLWNTALTTTQIGQLYNGGAPSNPSELGEFPTSRPSPVVASAASTGLDLDGSDDRLSVATDAGLNITNNLTVSLWANVTTATKTLASRYRTSSNRRAWRIASESGKMRVIVSADGNYSSGTSKDYVTTADVFGSGWVHVAFTFASGTLTLYVNGVAQAVTQTYNGTVATIYSTTTPATLIGGYENTGSGGVTDVPDGVIDDVSIWTAALSAGQVTTLYNAGVPSDLTGSANLLAWWRMGEGSTYSTINDSVGTRHMTMQNMAADDFVAGVPGALFYNNEAKATAYDAGIINGRWKVFSGSTALMADDGPTFGCNSDANASDAYFKFTLTSSASIEIDTINSAIDTVIGVFPSTATSFNNGEALGCNDDAAGSPADSYTTGTLAAGTYYVVIKGDALGDAGAYEISFKDVAGAGAASDVLGTRVACDDDDGTESTSRITASLAAGDYNVVVKSTGGSGAYTLRISEQGAATGRIACAAPNAIDAGSSPDTTCTYQTHNGHGYWFCSTDRSWTDARTRCQAIGFDLIAIDDSSEQTFANTYRSGETHIGYTDSATESTFVWSNGSASSFTAWGSGQPNNSGGGQDCSEIYYGDGTWNDNDCSSESQDYICESGALYDTAIEEVLAAGTYYVIVKGAAADGEGAYSMLIEDSAAGGAPLACNDDGAIDGSSAIEADLLAGTTYYVAVKGKADNAEGAYQITLRDVTGVPSNLVACGNQEIASSLTAGQTYYAVVKGDSVAGDGPFSLVLQDADNTGAQSLQCDDDSGPGSQSLITRTLDPGTYYLALKKANHAQGQGNYQISFGGAASVAGTYAPPTWAQTISALNADDIRVMTVYSTGGSDTLLLNQHATALANATDALGQNGDPLVSTMAGDGSGLSVALVNQIQELAQYLEMDVQLRVSYDPDTPPAPGFLFNFVAVDESPGNGCTSVVGIEHQDCLPGAVPRFQVSITNPLGTPVPPNMADPNGGYNFRLQLIANDRYVVDEVPVYIVPVMDVVVPPMVQYDPVGTYWQDVDGRSCAGNQRPSWRDLLFTTTLPADTRVEFDACTGETTAALDACAYLPVVTVAGTTACTLPTDCAMGETCESNGVCRLITGPACVIDTECEGTATCINSLCTYTGSPVSLLQGIGADNNYRNLLRIRMTMHANTALTEAPSLDQWQIRYECNDVQ